MESQARPDIGAALAIQAERERQTTNFEKELVDLLNKYSMESGSHTPDFILATYLVDCLKTFDKCMTRRTSWYTPRTK